MTDNRCVILFVKLPEPGKVKSRLAQDMDGDMVRHLYECMVLDAIDMLERTETPFRISFDPSDAEERVRQWLGQAYSYMPQTGHDLGARMEQAFTRVFSEGVSDALLIGSDIPSLTTSIIAAAFRSFSVCDAVIGPANDGGYYLIGFKKGTFKPGIFRGMAWSTKTVFLETLGRLEKASLAVHRLPELRDIDTREDVEAYLSHARHAEPGASRTVFFLRKHHQALFTRHRTIRSHNR
ncbi:MAG TPA: TIGR04282 family arsenosugar biosynthesis glycosyltransferase [Nitrospirota bacterium]|nr:TIGR04282 family arsenosugar biosynthesis glycosyltransferase [Nitrospirota bacterium]